MPRYDYKCTSCSTEFELVQTFQEAGKGVCPECSGAGQRVFHAVPVIYKGSGFYTTDYGRPKRPSENGSKDAASSKTSDSSSKSTEGSASSSGESSSSSSSTASDSKKESASKSTNEATTSS